MISFSPLTASNLRGPTTIVGLACHMLGYVFNRGFTETNIRGLRYFGVVFTQMFGTFPHPLVCPSSRFKISRLTHATEHRLVILDSARFRGTSTRHGHVSSFDSPCHPIRVVLIIRVIMGANCAGIYGAQIFRADDAPRYRRGFVIGIAILAFGVLLAGIRYAADVAARRRDVKQTASDLDREERELDEDRSSSGAVAVASDIQPAPIEFGRGVEPIVSRTLSQR